MHMHRLYAYCIYGEEAKNMIHDDWLGPIVINIVSYGTMEMEYSMKRLQYMYDLNECTNRAEICSMH